MNPGDVSYGQELRSCRLDEIHIAEVTMPAGLNLQPHSHDMGQLCFVLEGEYSEDIRGKRIGLQPGSIHFRAPGEQHANQFFSDDDVLALVLSFERNRWIEIVSESPRPADGLLREVPAAIGRELRRLRDAGSLAALEAWCTLSLVQVARLRSGPAPPPWLDDAVEFIRVRSGESLSLSRVAAAINVHRATLSAAFRRFRHLSVGEEIRWARVRAASRLLKTRQPLADVAIQSGFCDQAHFTRTFKALTGVSPSAYRRAHEAGRLDSMMGSLHLPLTTRH